MVRLTREVRFGIDADGNVAPEGSNGFAGRPALTGIGHFLALRITLEGEPDLESGYLRNIRDIDEVVRNNAIPVLQTAIRERTSLADQRHIFRLMTEVDRLPGATIVAGELMLSPFLSIAWNKSETDMIRLSQKFEFSAAHRLHNPSLSDIANRELFGKCNNPFGHGHNYEIQVTVAGIPNEKTGQLIPVEALERIVEEQVIGAFDHKHLNFEVPEFQSLNPTVENIAQVIFQRLAPALSQTPAKLARVTVWETPKTWAEVTEG